MLKQKAATESKRPTRTIKSKKKKSRRQSKWSISSTDNTKLPIHELFEYALVI